MTIEHSPLGNTSIELTRGFLVYCQPQQQQYYRPFMSNITGSGINSLLNATDNGKLFNPATLSGVAGSLIMPSTTPQGKVHIPNNFDTGRFAFFIEITIKGPMGRRREIITGFTDRAAVSHGGAIDPKMTFHLNSVTLINDFNAVGANGSTHAFNVNSSAQILASNESVGGDNLVALRPEDVIKSGQITNMFGSTNNLVANDDRVIDTRLMIDDNAKLSVNDNNLPSHYINKSVNAYLNAAVEIDTGSYDEDSVTGLYDGAIGRVRSPSIGTSKFYNSIDIRDSRSTHMVSFDEINCTWPRDSDFWKVVMPRPGSHVSGPLQNSEGFGGASMSHQIAYQMTHALPVIMSRFMLMELEFSATNMTMDGSIEIAIIRYTEMFDNTTTPNVIEVIKDNIRNDILLGIFSTRTGTYSLLARTNLITESTFMIGLNGEPPVPFIAPMFCASYSTPVIGMGVNELGVINDGIESIVKSMDMTGLMNNSYDPVVGSYDHGNMNNKLLKNSDYLNP